MNRMPYPAPSGLLAIPANTEVYCNNCSHHIGTTKDPIVIGRDEIRASIFYPDEGQLASNRSSVCEKCGLSWLPTMFMLSIRMSGQRSEVD